MAKSYKRVSVPVKTRANFLEQPRFSIVKKTASCIGTDVSQLDHGRQAAVYKHWCFDNPIYLCKQRSRTMVFAHRFREPLRLGFIVVLHEQAKRVAEISQVSVESRDHLLKREAEVVNTCCK